MKTNELRIGNFVFTDGELSKILGIYHDGRISTTKYEGGDLVNFIDPIPLTEEWLLRHKFEKSKTFQGWDSMKIINDAGGFFHLVYRMYDGRWDFLMIGSSVIMAEIIYVHQLQNLYFALTGNELEEKEYENNN